MTSAASLAERYAGVRGHTMTLASPLSEEDCCAQSMPDASPVKWHLAYTTWLFETFVLEQHEPAFRPFDPAFRVLLNSYYKGVGDKHPRAQRGLLTRPPLAVVIDHRRNVDERTQVLFRHPADDTLQSLVELGLNHEQQHHELLLTDIKHLLSLNPIRPAYMALAATPGSASEARWGSTSTFCAAAPAPRRTGTHAPATAISFPPRRAGSSPEYGWPRMCSSHVNPASCWHGPEVVAHHTLMQAA